MFGDAFEDWADVIVELREDVIDRGPFSDVPALNRKLLGSTCLGRKAAKRFSLAKSPLISAHSKSGRLADHILAILSRFPLDFVSAPLYSSIP